MNYFSSIATSLKSQIQTQVSKVKTFIEEEAKELQKEQEAIIKNNEEGKSYSYVDGMIRENVGEDKE